MASNDLASGPMNVRPAKSLKQQAKKRVKRRMRMEDKAVDRFSEKSAGPFRGGTEYVGPRTGEDLEEIMNGLRAKGLRKGK